MASVKEISIIIPTMNRKETLKECLTKIKASKGRIKEIIIIDQSKNPIDIEYLKQFTREDYKFKLIYQKKPSSTKARNKGIDNSTGDILLFMDDDTLIEEDVIIEVLEDFNDNSISLVAAIDSLSDTKQKYQDIFGQVFFRKNIKKNKKGYVCKGAFLGRYPSKKNNSQKYIKTEWAMGYFFAIKKDIVDEYNLRFDENLISYAYSEDLDFTYSCYKISKKNNNKMFINTNIRIKHLGSQEFRVENKKTLSMYVINRLYFSYKHFKNPIYRVVMIWSDIGEVIRRIIVKSEYKQIIKAYIECLKNKKDLKNKKINEKLLELIR